MQNTTSHSVEESSAELYLRTRETSVTLCKNLQEEDYVIQVCPDVSPAKWNLGHTTWFFENFILRNLPDYQPVRREYFPIFNSYYKSQGDHWIQAERGRLSRPTVAEVLDYRRVVDEQMVQHLKSGRLDWSLVELGIHHEQQHIELLLMDIKRNFFESPLNLSLGQSLSFSQKQSPLGFHKIDGGLHHIGHSGEGFGYDNEKPGHTVFLNDFFVSDRLVTCKEYQDFIEDGGYQKPHLWHSPAWDWIQSHQIQGPLYWKKTDRGWKHYTLEGWASIPPDEPISHVNFFEAHAYADWAGYRLPTEAEWEIAAKQCSKDGAFFEAGYFRPPSNQHQGYDWAGTLWQWTESAHLPHPGYRKPAGAFGEYNAKFMINQMILKGGSFATPRDHFRQTYRNFYAPEKNWMFSGIRLAKDT